MMIGLQILDFFSLTSSTKFMLSSFKPYFSLFSSKPPKMTKNTKNGPKTPKITKNH